MLFWGPQIVVEHKALYASLHVPGSEADSEGIILLQKEMPRFLEESPDIVGMSVSSPNGDPWEAADGSSMLVINQAQFIADVYVLFPTTVSPSPKRKLKWEKGAICPVVLLVKFGRDKRGRNSMWSLAFKTMFVISIDFYRASSWKFPGCLTLPRSKCNLQLSFNCKTYFVCLPDTFNKLAFRPLYVSRHNKSNSSNSRRKAFFEKNLSLIVCSCNRRHHQLKCPGPGSAQMKRPRADLMISHLRGTEGRGASVWNFLSQQCHLQRRPGSKAGWCEPPSSGVSLGRVLERDPRTEVVGWCWTWGFYWEWRPQIASGPGAGLFLEERPVFPQWAPEAEQKPHQQKNTGQDTYWEPPLVNGSKGEFV